MNYTFKDTILYINNVELGYEVNNSFLPVLKNINLEEKDLYIEGQTTGQVIAFIGASGSGKSTLFRALTGLVKPNSGQILISKDSKAKVVEQGDVGFVNQKYTLFEHKTVFKTLTYALRNSGLKNDNLDNYILKNLEQWNLLSTKDKYPNELSGGQRQRVAIIEQLLTSKTYIVLDEPFSGLDVKNIEVVKESFNFIKNANELNTIIFSTHDISLAVELADSIYIIGPSKELGCNTIVEHIDMKPSGLAFKPYGSEHISVVNKIKNTLLKF